MLLVGDIPFALGRWFTQNASPPCQGGSGRCPIHPARGSLGRPLISGGTASSASPSPHVQPSQARCYLGPYLTKNN